MKNDATRRRAVGVELASIIFCATGLVAWLPARAGGEVTAQRIKSFGIAAQ